MYFDFSLKIQQNVQETHLKHTEMFKVASETWTLVVHLSYRTMCIRNVHVFQDTLYYHSQARLGWVEGVTVQRIQVHPTQKENIHYKLGIKKKRKTIIFFQIIKKKYKKKIALFSIKKKYFWFNRLNNFRFLWWAPMRGLSQASIFPRFI